MSEANAEDVGALVELISSRGWRVLLRELEKLSENDAALLDRADPRDVVLVAQLQTKRKVRRQVAGLPEERLRLWKTKLGMA